VRWRGSTCKEVESTLCRQSLRHESFGAARRAIEQDPTRRLHTHPSKELRVLERPLDHLSQ
jgi:hypothetical protein